MQILLILVPVVFSAKYGGPILLFLQKHVNRKQNHYLLVTASSMEMEQ